ncbi:MAG: thioesterase family protein [Hansschlegelia sp.]
MRPDPLPRSAYGFACAQTTRWADNDVYGHVNNALYYSFLDTTITAYLISAGLDAAAGGPMIFVATSDCAYFRPFAFPEPVDSGLAVASVGRTSVTWRIGLFGAGEDAPRAQGRFVHVCVDRATRAPTAWPQGWLDAFEAIRLKG